MLATVGVVAPTSAVAQDAGSSLRRSSACAPDAATAQWIQRAIGAWETISVDALRLAREPMPWMVFFDDTCAWHVGFEAARLDSGAVPVSAGLSWNGAPIEVRAVAHRGLVRLPDGSAWPARDNTARASFYRGTEATYFVVATPNAWRREPALAADPSVEEFFLGVATHELTHTRHLPFVLDRLRAVAKRYGLSNLSLDDDVVQNTFAGNNEFRTAVEAERDVFYEAAGEPVVEARRALIRKGLAMARARRATHFTGRHEQHKAFEDVFLSLEGAGQWASYMVARRSRAPAEAVAFVRDNKRYWSQEEGLALFLLLDLEVPDWQRVIFSTDDPGALALLEKALETHQ
jgi:hypothetical protein